MKKAHLLKTGHSVGGKNDANPKTNKVSGAEDCKRTRANQLGSVAAAKATKDFGQSILDLETIASLYVCMCECVARNLRLTSLQQQSQSGDMDWLDWRA